MSTTIDRSGTPAIPGERGIDARTSPTPAVRGISPGREGWTGADDGSGVAKFLGWFSLALGAAEVIAPRGLTRLIGMEPSRASTSVMRAMGIREMAHGLGILANPKSKAWVGTRIGGDALDLALLGVAVARSDHPERALLATGAVLGVAVLDVIGTERLAERRKAPSREIAEEPGSHVYRNITIERPVQEVFDFWHDVANLPRFMKHLESVEPLGSGRSRWRAKGPVGAVAEWEAEAIEIRPNELISWQSVGDAEIYNSGTVRFQSALGGRATIVTVEMRYAPPGGEIGAAILKLFRREPGQQVGDDLRRLKQLLETGEVVVSDATMTSRPRAAQPLGRGEMEARAEGGR